jgi:hypothetical protein
MAVGARAAVLFVGAAAVVAAGRSGSPSGRELSNYGLSIVLPAGWKGSITLRPGPGGLPVVRAAKPRQASLLVSEVGNRPGTNGFDRTRLPIRLRATQRWRFSYGGRSFVASAAARPVARREARKVLASLRIAVVSAPSIWARLRRPLHLPRVRTDVPCRRARHADVGATVAWPVGDGPVYVGLGSPHAVAVLRDDLRRGRFSLHKTLWAIGPRYRGPVLIRGRKLDGTASLRFSFTRRMSRELHVVRDYLQARGWRYSPSTTAIPGPGCYAFQVDGARFSEVITFEARR